MNAEFEGQTEAINTLNSELNPICHSMVLLGTNHILHISEVRVKDLGSEMWLMANISIKIMPLHDLQKTNFTCFIATTLISIIVLHHVTLRRRYCPF